MIQEFKIILDENSNITEEVKDNILELINLFASNFKDVKLDTLKERLKSLKIKRESMYLAKLPCEYKPFNNEIIINIPRFEECDAKHWLMHALLGIITAKDNYYGFNNSDDTFIALNEGYTEIVMTNLISKIIGENTFYEAYFNNDSQRLLKAMIEAEAK